ncbi:MAG: ABC transporter permease, partial [Rhizomicrobium sp.]
MTRLFNILLPLALGLVLLGLWEVIVVVRHIPPYVLPAPRAIAHALVDNFPSLMTSLFSTLTVTLEGFIAAWIAGVGLAIAFSQSRSVERALYPYAVVLQVTPVVAIAPLILIW